MICIKHPYYFPKVFILDTGAQKVVDDTMESKGILVNLYA